MNRWSYLRPPRERNKNLFMEIRIESRQLGDVCVVVPQVFQDAPALAHSLPL